jgi:hypothetical protein
MKKDAYYFPHDSNAQHDPKCAALIHDHGMVGYGFYWCLIELLHQQTGGKLEKFPKLFDGMAHEFGCEKEFVVKQIEALLHEYFLLQEDEKYIWSERVLRNLEEKEEKRQIKVEAGRVGGIKSGLSRRSEINGSNNEAVVKANEAVVKNLKQSKVKESKRKENSNTDFSVEKKNTDFTDPLFGKNAGNQNFEPPKKGMVY